MAKYVIEQRLLSIFFFICLCFFVQFFNITPLSAQLKEVNPEEAGFSSMRLKRIDSMFISYTSNDHEVPGVVALIARNGKIVYFNAFGYNNISANKLMKKDDLFRIASQTKIVTGAAVMMLYDEGKIVLSDPISKYIPEFGNLRVLGTFNPKDTTYTTVPADRKVTIRDLLTHTSGLSYPIIGTEVAKAIYAKAGIPIGTESRAITLKEGMTKLSKVPLMHQPGKAFTYGLSIDVLGYLVEKVSGMSLEHFFQKKIFEPLGMKDTYFYVPREKRSRLATVYELDKIGHTRELISKDSSGLNTFYPLIDHGTYYSGGAGLCSSAYDYAIFLQMLLNGGIYNGHRLMSPYSVKLMTMNQINKRLPGWESDNGFGFTVEVISKDSPKNYPWQPGTFSWAGYWGSLCWVDPNTHLVAQIWTQDLSSSKDEMLNKFKVMVYSALTNP